MTISFEKFLLEGGLLFAGFDNLLQFWGADGVLLAEETKLSVICHPFGLEKSPDVHQLRLEPLEYRRVENPHIYKVGVSSGVIKLTNEIRRQHEMNHPNR